MGLGLGLDLDLKKTKSLELGYLDPQRCGPAVTHSGPYFEFEGLRGPYPMFPYVMFV